MKLYGSTLHAGAENEWLILQVVDLQEQSLRMDQEMETMQLHISQSQNLSKVMSNPKLPAHSRAFGSDSNQSRLPPLPAEGPPRQGHLQIPVSAFQVSLNAAPYA